MTVPQHGERSPDGHHWYDANSNQWQPLNDNQSDTAQASSSSQGGADASQAPAQQQQGDLTSRLLAKVNDPSELQGHFENSMANAENQATASA